MWRDASDPGLISTADGHQRRVRAPAGLPARPRVARRVQPRLVASLRYTAARATMPPTSARFQEPLLAQRALDVRADLLALAASIEHDPDPDPDNLIRPGIPRSLQRPACTAGRSDY